MTIFLPSKSVPKAPPSPAFIHNMILITSYSSAGDEITTATILWTLPTTRTDGSPLPFNEVKGSIVYDSGVFVGAITGVINSFASGVLANGSHNFTVVVKDLNNLSSASSNIASVNIFPVAQPSAVTDLKAVLN